MKKHFVLFFLCFALLFAVACGGENTPPATPTPTESPTPSPSPTPTPTPANAAVEALDNLEDKLHAVLSWEGTGDYDLEQGLGYDITMDISINQMLMNLLGMTDLNHIGIDMSMDMSNDLCGYNIALFIGEDEFFNFDMISDYNKLLMNVPKYSSEYALSGNNDTSSTGLTSSAIYGDLTEVYQKFISDSFLSVRPVEGYTDNATLEVGNYRVTGRKFSVHIPLEDLSKTLNEFLTSLQEMFPDSETEITEITSEDYELLVLDYYTNENGTFAWVCYPDTAPEEALGFISAENGWCFFNKQDTDPLFYTEKSTATTGTFYFPDEESTLTLVYETGENSIILYEPDSELTASAKWQFSEKYISLDFTLSTADFSVVYTLVSEGNSSHTEMTLTSYDTQLGTISADCKIRDYRPVTMPETWLDAETWRAQFDTDAFRADIEAMAEASPQAISDFLIGFYEGFTQTDITPENDTPSAEPSITPEIPLGPDFSVLTGYAVDEYGDVNFLALEEEVLALGLTSTGIYGTPITEEQTQTLLNYGSSVLDNCYSESGTFYEISGNVFDSVDSYFYTEYYSADAANYYNQVDLYLEAITGDFYMVGVANTSKENAFSMANDILSILGEANRLDISLDAASLNEGVWIGDFLVYGWDNGDYFLIRIY